MINSAPPPKRCREEETNLDNKTFKLARHKLPGNRWVTVVHDEYLLGGTKSRFVPAYLNSVQKGEVVYASSQEGFAQIALAACAQELNKKVTIFTSQRNQEHPNVKLVRRLGAHVVLVPVNGFLHVLQSRAKKYVEEDPKNRQLVPFGMMTDDIIATISQFGKALLLESGMEEPKECWLPTSSGTLLRGLMVAWPQCFFHGVSAEHQPKFEPKPHNLTLYRATGKYSTKAKKNERPPFDSCVTFDAKVWKFVENLSADGALVWNVAGNIPDNV